MAPMGVMSDSPVARQTTSDRKNVSSTAMKPRCQGMPNCVCPMKRTPMVPTEASARNQDPGTSTVACAALPDRPMPPTARMIVRHWVKNVSRPAEIIMGAPIQMPISRQARPALCAAPAASAAGPTAYISTSPPATMEKQMRGPVSAPAAIMTSLLSSTKFQSLAR